MRINAAQVMPGVFIDKKEWLNILLYSCNAIYVKKYF